VGVQVGVVVFTPDERSDAGGRLGRPVRVVSHPVTGR